MLKEPSINCTLDEKSDVPSVDSHSSKFISNLAEEDVIEFMSSWNLLAAFTLMDLQGFKLSIDALSSKLNLSKAESEAVIESLLRVGVIKKCEQSGEYLSSPLHLTNANIPSSDVLNLFLKFNEASASKLTSKDVFSFHTEVMSKKVIVRYIPEFYRLISKIAEESKGQDDCEAYGANFLFSKMSRSRRDK